MTCSWLLLLVRLLLLLAQATGSCHLLHDACLALPLPAVMGYADVGRAQVGEAAEPAALGGVKCYVPVWCWWIETSTQPVEPYLHVREAG
eukprot:CAMPEP_0202895934 /NCGR_PEP_ID=MMETSP1392-20130828/5040_1 /ASSEMBLY_ACC=CAM_ASM_000868 /TAXON_ID=225041 /ORGANISM="Chlamydomonas chlamydogama, Strain SAG 11-48b" /LENGTH=89 /DNA_ID=CAMNT_0049581121 /DNA_START=295 /DNA_END=564 /DNA_ORIENTATION=+